MKSLGIRQSSTEKSSKTEIEREEQEYQDFLDEYEEEESTVDEAQITSNQGDL